MPTIHSFHLSDPGQKRANNEDAVGSYEPKDSRQLRRSGRLYIVADGLGGHQMGEQASQLVVESLLKFYYEAPEILPEKRLRDIIQQVHQKLIAARRNMASGDKMATTVVAAVVRNDTLQVAHVGDSRAYLLRDGELHQVTRDHSFVGEMRRAGAVTEEEAMQSPYRNRLTRSVGGGDGALEVDVTPPIPLRPGDSILLCTDGLTQYATSQDLLAAASYGSPHQVVERLIRFANSRGGSDNITVAAIKFGKKSAIPALPSWKTLAAAGAGALLLVLLAFFGLHFAGRLTAQAATFTPTLLPTHTATPFSTQTLAPTPTSTELPTETALPQPSGSPEPPVPAGLVDCRYTVQSGDTAGQIAKTFQTVLAQVFREDGSQENLSLIYTGETLIINDITGEACQNGGGESLPPSTISP
ncbi:MAG: protein phosphatase 2C domain-containing protein [Chloroflexota bacterium]